MDYDQYSTRRSEQESVQGGKKKKKIVKKVKKRPVSQNALPTRDMPHFDPNRGQSNQYYMMRN